MLRLSCLSAEWAGCSAVSLATKKVNLRITDLFHFIILIFIQITQVDVTSNESKSIKYYMCCNMHQSVEIFGIDGIDFFLLHIFFNGIYWGGDQTWSRVIKSNKPQRLYNRFDHAPPYLITS